MRERDIIRDREGESKEKQEDIIQRRKRSRQREERKIWRDRLRDG